VTDYAGAVIVGAVESPYTRHPPEGTRTETLLADAFALALESTGIDREDVDGLGVASFTHRPDRAIDLAWKLGLRPRWLMDDGNGGASGIQLLQHAVRAIQAGASGYLTKESAPAQLVSAIRKVAGGGAFITDSVAQQLALGAMPQTEGPPHSTLSDREFQVFRELVSGKAVSDIAAQLNLSVKTVSTHKARIMQKMNMSNPAELIRYAIRHQLIDDPGSAS